MEIYSQIPHNGYSDNGRRKELLKTREKVKLDMDKLELGTRLK
jgi:hypothetical protein